jgi:hypothetical protein
MYRITYEDDEGELVTRQCKNIEDSGIGFGFLRLSEFVFESRGGLSLPGESKLNGIKALHIHPHSVRLVEEMEDARLELDRPSSPVLVLPTD